MKFVEKFKRLDREVLWGGIFGLIAVLAIIAEMIIGKFDGASIAGGIKDVAGTIVAVMIFIFAAKTIFKKEDASFNAVFAEEMEKIETKYTPLLRKAEDGGDERRARKFLNTVRYELSTHIEALVDGEAKSYASFLNLIFLLRI